MSAVDLEIAVEREHFARLVQLGQPQQAGVGQRCGHVVMALEQRTHRHDLRRQAEIRHHAALDHLQGARPDRSRCAPAKSRFQPAPRRRGRLGQGHTARGSSRAARRRGAAPPTGLCRAAPARVLINAGRPDGCAGLVDKSAGPPAKQPTRSGMASGRLAVAGWAWCA